MARMESFLLELQISVEKKVLEENKGLATFVHILIEALEITPNIFLANISY